MQQANAAAHKLNMETIARADAEKNQIQPAPTSKKTYHFDGTAIPQSSEEFVNNYEDFSESQGNVENLNDETQNVQPLPKVSAEMQNENPKLQYDLKQARQDFWEGQEKLSRSNRVVKELKQKADKIFQDFKDGKIDASKTYEKLETLQTRARKNTILNEEQKAEVEDYIENIKSDIVDYLHGEKEIEMTDSAEENPTENISETPQENSDENVSVEENNSEENLQEDNSEEETSRQESEKVTETEAKDSEEVKAAKAKVSNLNEEMKNIQRGLIDAYSEVTKR